MSLLSANLQAFLAVVRQGTVHGAADVLHLTQTGVTQRLRSLEGDLGATLFTRSRKGMTLTSEGQALLRYCNAATELEGPALSAIRGSGKVADVFVTVVGPTSVMTSRIAGACRPLYENFPSLHLNLIVNDDANLVPMVRDGSVQLAIVAPEFAPNEMDSKLLKPDKFVLVASPKWKGRNLVDIIENERIIDFAEGDSTTLRYLKKFSLQKHIRRPRIFVNNNEAIIELFKGGVGFGTLTKEVAEPHLKSGELVLLNQGAMMDSPLALVWYPRTEMPLYFKSLLKCLV